MPRRKRCFPLSLYIFVAIVFWRYLMGQLSSDQQTLRSHFDELASQRASWIDKNRYYHEDLARYFRFLVTEDANVLELGSGTGDLLNALRPARGFGIDISGKMVALARSRFPHLQFRQGDMETIAPWGEKFEFIILSDVIGHLHDVEETIRNLRGFCTEDTRLIISYYNFLWEPILKLGEKVGMKMPQAHQNWLSATDISNLLSLAEFQVVKTESRLLIPKRVPFISNFINRYLAPVPGIRQLCLSQYIVARPLHVRQHLDFSTTIIIPCRNEKGNIHTAIQRMPSFGKHQEIIFVDGHSTDGTPDEISRVIGQHPEKDIKFMVQTGKGKGDAVQMGFAKASGEILMILDADLTVPPEDLPKFYRAIANDHGEFINGCRLVYPMEKQAMRFLNLIGNKFFSIVFTWILNQRFKDTLCGTKVLFKRHYIKIRENRGYFGHFDPFGDFELIFGAVKQNLKIVEIPVRYRERTYGKTNIKRFQHGLLLFRMTLFGYKKFKVH